VDLGIIAAVALEGKDGTGYAQRAVVLVGAAWLALLAPRLWQLSSPASAVVQPRGATAAQ
jgi:hypothetical protein